MRLLGLSFWQAWWMLSMCTATILPFGDDAFSLVSPVIVIMALSALGYFAIILISRRFSPFFTKKSALVFAAVSSPMGSAAMAILANTGAFDALGLLAMLLYLLAALLFSLGNALLLIMWGELWSTLATARVGRYLCVSYAFAFVIYFCVFALPIVPRAALLALLPAISVLILANARKEPRRNVTSISYHLEPYSRLKILAAIAGLSLTFGISQQVLVAIAASPDAVTATFVAAGACVVALALRIWAAAPQLEALVFYRPITSALVVGLILMALLPISLVFIGGGLVVLAIYCLDMLMMLVSADIAFRTRKPVAMLFGASILAGRIGTLVGTLLFQQFFGDALYTEWGEGGSPLSLLPMALPSAAEASLAPMAVLELLFNPQSLLLICAVAAILIGCLLFSEGDLLKLYRPRIADAPNTQPTHKRCKRVADLCGLTQREQEVLQLLATGRSIPFISKELSIANGTAKHHVSSIYRKLGVYDRQGLHDVIEQGEAGRGAL